VDPHRGVLDAMTGSIGHSLVWEIRQEGIRLGLSVGHEPSDVRRLTRQLARVVQTVFQLLGHADKANGNIIRRIQPEVGAEVVRQQP
jgi:hypothetical protein